MNTPVERAAKALWKGDHAPSDQDIARAVFESIEQEGLADAIESFGIDWEMGSRKQPLADYQAAAIIDYLTGDKP